MAAPGFIRVPASQLGLAGDLELAFPLGLACFRTRGSRRGYCHGGISLQEFGDPRWQPSAFVSLGQRSMGTATVLLTLAKPTITTRFFSIEARYVVAGLFGEDTERIKGVVREHRTEVGVSRDGGLWVQRRHPGNRP